MMSAILRTTPREPVYGVPTLQMSGRLAAKAGEPTARGLAARAARTTSGAATCFPFVLDRFMGASRGERDVGALDMGEERVLRRAFRAMDRGPLKSERDC